MEKEMHDSGKRQGFSTGAVRDTGDDKPGIDLFSHYMFRDLLAHEGYDDILEAWFNFKHYGTKDYLLDMFLYCCEKEQLTTTQGITRTAYWLTEGAKKYARRNWQAGIPVERVIASMDRHLVAWMDQDQKEDHLAALMCNIMFIYHYKCLIAEGYMDESIDDYVYTNYLVQRDMTPKTVVQYIAVAKTDESCT